MIEEIRREFNEWHRNADPLNISARTKVPATEVLPLFEKFKNIELREMVIMSVDINKPLNDEFERIVSEGILRIYKESKKY